MNRQLQKVEGLPSQLVDENGEYEAGLKQLATRDHFTGDDFFKRYLERYKAICRLIAECIPSAMIAFAFKVSHNTVEAIRRRENYPIEQERKQLLETIRSGARVCAERVLELAPTMTPKEAAIAFGILSDKMLLLQGEATSIVMNKEDTTSHQSFNDLLAALPKADAQSSKRKLAKPHRQKIQTLPYHENRRHSCTN